MDKSRDNFRTIFNPLRKILPYVRYIGAAKLPPGGKYRNTHIGFEICYVDSGLGEFQQGKTYAINSGRVTSFSLYPGI